MILKWVPDISKLLGQSDSELLVYPLVFELIADSEYDVQRKAIRVLFILLIKGHVRPNIASNENFKTLLKHILK
jgi:hypothetical protein